MKKILTMTVFLLSAASVQAAPTGVKNLYSMTENVDVPINTDTFKVYVEPAIPTGCPPHHACDPTPAPSTIRVNYSFNNGPYAISGFKHTFRSNQIRDQDILRVVQAEADQNSGKLPATLSMSIYERADDEYGCDGKTPDGKPANIMVCCHQLNESIGRHAQDGPRTHHQQS